MTSHKQHGHGVHDAHVSGPAWLPVALAILLGVAAMVAGAIGWRAAVHSGEAQREFALSTQADNNANSLQQNAFEAAISERSLFVAYEDAVSQHDLNGAADARGVMDPPTVGAIDWWLHQPADSRPSSPFAAANPEWTTPRMIIDARDALDESVATLTSADEQIHRSHDLELLDAMLAIAFLTGGLTATLESRSAQAILLAVSVAVLIVAAVGLVGLW
ncbi:MAG: hypothetical protein ACLPVY_06780 [Acidimicrobiia bacterium]